MSCGIEKNETPARAKNFTNEEVLLLSELVGKNRSVIENKQSGVITHKQKEAAWQKLTMEFNASTSGDHRSTKMLIEKWRNTKKTSTKSYSANKKSLYKTGGGPKDFSIVLETPVDAIVHDIIGARMTRYEAECDSDYMNIYPRLLILVMDPKQILPFEMNLSSTNEQHDNLPSSSLNDSNLAVMHLHKYEEQQGQADWSDYSPALLKTPTSKLLSTTKAELEEAVKKHQEERELVQLKKKILLEAHQLKMEQMREEHALKLKLMSERKPFM
ncbi:hypothetical protein NQ314_010932 [Rhamnusium bicolor]|uniref:Regulatory protein zeste n=1 Tax=Rhamnusium bicolor TaxID=1586634 RepID=A0AAV8XNE8_9CUCU|nr:hypothetical protein NQ314_010932 [Rhamnusium bicolor]